MLGFYFWFMAQQIPLLHSKQLVLMPKASKRHTITLITNFHQMHVLNKKQITSSTGVLNFVCLMPSLVSCISYLYGSECFSRGYVVGPNFFSWVYRETQIFSRGYITGPKFFLLDILWVGNFFSWVIFESTIISHGLFMANL